MRLTWDTMSAPSTVDFSSFRFVNERFGASSNAITRDGGENVDAVDTSVESALFFPLDTANFYIASRNARSQRIRRRRAHPGSVSLGRASTVDHQPQRPCRRSAQLWLAPGDVRHREHLA